MLFDLEKLKESGCPQYKARDVLKFAREHGRMVVAADDWHLQLDLDQPETGKHSEASAAVCIQSLLLGDQLDTVSPGGRTHRYIKLTRPLPLVTRVALQLAFGSDPLREVLALGYEGYVEPALVLFETPAEYARVVAFLGRF